MFTGVVQAVGKIVRVHPLEVECPALGLADIAVGDSICVQGVCLTVSAITPHGFTADVSGETLRVSTQPEPAGFGPSIYISKSGGVFVASHDSVTFLTATPTPSPPDY